LNIDNRFREAAESWADSINSFYGIDADVFEVIDAFDRYTNVVDEKYINTFFKTRGGDWCLCLDTEDRVALASLVEEFRG